MTAPPDLKSPILIIGAGVGEAIFQRCAACHTVWPAVRVPVEAREFAKTAARSRCPYCGCDKSFLARHPLETR